MFCPNCGSEIPEGAGFCASCGFSVSGAKAAGKIKNGNISIEILKRAFAVILKKPFTLWGLSLMSVLLVFIACILGGPVLGVGIAVGYVLELGMAWIYLDGYRGEEVSSKQLFEPFKTFWKSFAGMGWMGLWELIWFLIPIVGPIFCIIKSYSYGLTPYILREKDMSPNEALKESMARTNGYKGKMFLTDLLICVFVFIPLLVLALLGMIPYVGVIFMVLYVICVLIVTAFGGLYCGLVKAAWYEEITNGAKEDAE